jgi:hypothetical protein
MLFKPIKVILAIRIRSVPHITSAVAQESNALTLLQTLRPLLELPNLQFIQELP